MRKIGFLLLLIGFGWLSRQQLDMVMRTEIRSVGTAQSAKLSTDPGRRYTEQDVRAHIRETALAVHAHFPFVLAPGLLMLSGGLLLAFARGRSRTPMTHDNPFKPTTTSGW